MKSIEIIADDARISFVLRDEQGLPLVSLRDNGDVYVNGILVGNNLEAVEAVAAQLEDDELSEKED